MFSYSTRQLSFTITIVLFCTYLVCAMVGNINPIRGKHRVLLPKKISFAPISHLSFFLSYSFSFFHLYAASLAFLHFFSGTDLRSAEKYCTLLTFSSNVRPSIPFSPVFSFSRLTTAKKYKAHRKFIGFHDGIILYRSRV